MTKPALIAALLALSAGQASAAGSKLYFGNWSWQSATVRDCFEKSAGPAENRVCAEAEYRLQDDRLNRAYKALRAVNTPAQNDSLQFEERDWIAFKTPFCDAWGAQDERANPGLPSDYYVLLCTAQVTSQRASELEYALTQHTPAK